MWRCPDDSFLTDLAKNCGFCGLGIADFESNGWEVATLFEAVSSSEAKLIQDE